MAAENTSSIQSLSTETVEVTRTVVAHNAALFILGGFSHADSPEEEATRYATLFNQIYGAIRPQRSNPTAAPARRTS